MKCFLCKGQIEDKLSTFTADLGSCVLIVRDVPSQVCEQCGGVSYSARVMSSLEKIAAEFPKGGTEIAVLKYNAAA